MRKLWRHGVLRCLAVVVLVLLSQPVPASEAPDMARLEDLSARTEGAIRAGTVSTPILERLRSDLAAQREVLERRTEAGDLSVNSLRAALAELGPPPPEGQAEARQIAEERAALRDALAEADAPHRAERQALARVRLLIAALDRQIHERDRARILTRGPSPMDPTTLRRGTADFTLGLERMADELKAQAALPSRAPMVEVARRAALVTLPLAVLLWAVLLPWLLARLEPAHLRDRPPGWGRITLVLLLSFALPWLSAVLLIAPFLLSGVRPAAATTFRANIDHVPLIFACAEVLGQALFAPRAPARRIIDLAGSGPRHALNLLRLLAVVALADLMLNSVSIDRLIGVEAQAVVGLLVLLAAALPLWKLSTLLIGTVSADRPQDLRVIVGQAMRVAVVLMLGLSAAGYAELSRMILTSLLPSLWLLGATRVALALVLGVIGRLRAWLIPPPEGAVSTPLWSFAPILLGVLLGAASLPLHALIWGTRTADVTEVLLLLRDGIDVGGARISVTTVLLGFATFLVGLTATRWTQRLLRQEVLPRSRIDIGGRSAIVTGFGYAGVILATILGIRAAGIDLASLAIVAGALSVGIGFGLQAIVSNFVSGLILLAERPVKEGDWIEVSGQSGIVRRISVRATRIETFDGHDLIVPNADLVTGVVRNMTLSSASSRITLPVGVAHGSDLEAVSACLMAAARSHRNVLARPEPQVLLMEPGDSAVQFELRCFVAEATMSAAVRSELYFAIFRAFAEKGIVLPFPVRDVRITSLPEGSTMPLATGAG